MRLSRTSPFVVVSVPFNGETTPIISLPVMVPFSDESMRIQVILAIEFPFIRLPVMRKLSESAMVITLVEPVVALI